MDNIEDTFRKIINDTIDAAYIRIAEELSEFARCDLIEDMTAKEALDYFAMRLIRVGKTK